MSDTLARLRCYTGEADLYQILARLQAGRAARIGSYDPHTEDLKWSLFSPPLEGALWQHI